MRSRVMVSVAFGLCVAAGDAGAQQQIELYASVVDTSGKAPATLEPTDITVTEDGAPAKVVKAAPATRPVKLQLLLDNGIGLGAQNVQFLRDGVKGLIEALPENLEVTIVTTAPQPRFLVRATTDKAAMIEGLSRLGPDRGAGRFVESMNEATQRIARDESDPVAIIVSAATNAGDADALDRDANQILERISRKPTTIHVILLSATPSASGGATQMQVGLAVTKGTGGRYEPIIVPARLATLLPEIGKQVAASQEKQGHQFKLTIERPAGKSGELGKISAGARSGLILLGMSMDGRAP